MNTESKVAAIMVNNDGNIVLFEVDLWHLSCLTVNILKMCPAAVTITGLSLLGEGSGRRRWVLQWNSRTVFVCLFVCVPVVLLTGRLCRVRDKGTVMGRQPAGHLC